MRKGKKLTKSQPEERIADLENKWKRAVADYINLEKRIEKEKKVLVEFSNAQLLDKILPILDELKICSEHLKDKGLKIVLAKFDEILKSEGIKEIKALAEEFNPELMDAVEIVAGPKDKVVKVVLKGYLLNDKVLRPAKVKVGGRKLAKEKLKKLETEKLRGEYV